VPRGARTVRITARSKNLRIETVAGSVVPQLTQTVAQKRPYESVARAQKVAVTWPGALLV
jgi:hypothetical protein